MSNGKLANTLLRLAALSVAFAAAVDGAGAPPRWIAIGPPGARSLVAAPDPAVPDRVYAATRGEVSVSLDGGLIFSRLGPLPVEATPTRPLPYVIGIAVLHGHGADQPGEARLVVQVYIGTVQQGGGPASSLYVSLDGGRNWTLGLDAETGKPIGAVGTVAAVPGSASVAFGWRFRTHDGGLTWRAFPVPSELYGPARTVPVTENLLVIADDEAGLFRTTDSGATWVSISAGLPAPPYSYVSIAADAREPTTLWLVIGDTGTFRSQDAGATWTQQGGRAGSATAYPRDLFADGDTLFSGNASYVYRSRDGGRTWTSLNIADNDPLGPIVARDATTGRLYFGNLDSGDRSTNLRFSEDDGDTLYPSERGLHGVDVPYIAADASGRLYSWSWDDGRLYRRDAVRDLWQDITPSNTRGCAGYYGPGPIVVAADGTLFTSGWRSADGGEHWIVSSPSPCLLAVAPDDHNVMYSRHDTLAGFGGILTRTTVYRSVDAGLTWEAINQPFTITDRLHAAGGSRLIALHYRQLAFSPDGGNNWSNPFIAVRDFSASASHPQIVLVADYTGMYRTEDGGATFTRLGELPDASIAHVALDPNVDHVAYAVTDRGRVYLSTDGGAKWAAVGGTLDPLVDLFDVVASGAAPSTLIAGTTHGVQTLYAADDQRELAEFYHPGFDHYFLSADPEEIYVLRTGGLPPWRPTGRWFWGWESDASGADPVCRFWSGQTFAPKSSHFYTPYPDECQGLQQGDVWLFEGEAFGWQLPTGAVGSRVCPAENWALYRAYNNGQGGAPNHRYTIDPAVLDAMIAQGWIMEGEAATRVFACVPAPE